MSPQGADSPTTNSVEGLRRAALDEAVALTPGGFDGLHQKCRCSWEIPWTASIGEELSPREPGHGQAPGRADPFVGSRGLSEVRLGLRVSPERCGQQPEVVVHLARRSRDRYVGDLVRERAKRLEQHPGCFCP